MSNGCKSRKFLLREDALDQRLSVRGQAVNRGIPIGTREGENLAKLGGAIRGEPGMSHFETRPNVHIVFCPLRADFPYPCRRASRHLDRRTGRNLFLGTVVFVSAQGRSFRWASYTGEGFTGTLQDFTVPYWRFSSHPPQQRLLQAKSVLGGSIRLDISSSHSGCCCSP